MTDDNLNSDGTGYNGNRRQFLKSIGAASTGLVISPGVVAAQAKGSTDENTVVESTLRDQKNPVANSDVRNLQKNAIKKYSGDGSAALFPEYRVPDGWFIAGYAVAIKDNVPSHMVQLAPEPQVMVQSDGQTFQKLPAVDRKHERINSFVKAFGGEPTGKTTTATSSAVTPAATSGDLSNLDPSPTDKWDKKGSTFMEGEVFVENHGAIGHLSHYVELWQSKSEEQSDTNDYCITQQMETAPGVELSDGHGWAYNYSSEIEADFNNANLFPYSFLDRSPTSDKTAVFDSEVSVGVSGDGGEATLSTNYDVPYVSRNVTINPGELNRYEYSYPDDPLKLGNEGYNNICEMDHLTLVRCSPIDADWDRVCESNCQTRYEWKDNVGNGHYDDVILNTDVSLTILT